MSTRERGSPDVVPSCEKKLLAPLGVTDTRTIGKPESCNPPVVGQMLGSPPGICPCAQSPMEVGWKLRSCGKNPSANRFQPYRSSLTLLFPRVCTYDSETSCTRVGVIVLNPGSWPPLPVNASGKD